MFERDEVIAKMVDAVYAECDKLSRGDTLEHGAIASLTGLEPHIGSWDHVVNTIRKRLLDEREIATWPETNVGYRLLTKREQLEFLPRKRLLKASRQEKRARKAVAALGDEGLTAHQRRMKYAQIDALKAAGKSIRSQLRLQSIIFRKQESHSRDAV